MSASVLYMSMSLDGYIAGPNDDPGNPVGDGFMRLHDWYGFAPVDQRRGETYDFSVGFMSAVQQNRPLFSCTLTDSKRVRFNLSHSSI